MDVDSLGTRIQALPVNSEINEASHKYPVALTLAPNLTLSMCTASLVKTESSSGRRAHCTWLQRADCQH